MNIAVYISYSLAAAAICTVSGCGKSDTSQWKEFSSKEGQFALLMPGIPEEKKSVTQTRIGPIKDHSFMLKAQQGELKAAYLVSYADYPKDRPHDLSPNTFLEQTWQAAFGDLGNRLIYKKSITLNGFAGSEFQYRGKGASTSLVTSRNYLVNNRLYQLSAVMSKKQAERGDAQKYLDSFRLLK